MKSQEGNYNSLSRKKVLRLQSEYWWFDLVAGRFRWPDFHDFMIFMISLTSMTPLKSGYILRIWRQSFMIWLAEVCKIWQARPLLNVIPVRIAQVPFPIHKAQKSCTCKLVANRMKSETSVWVYCERICVNIFDIVKEISNLNWDEDEVRMNGDNYIG